MLVNLSTLIRNRERNVHKNTTGRALEDSVFLSEKSFKSEFELMLEFSYNLLFPIKKKLLTSQRFQNLRKAVLALMLFPSAIDQTRVLKYTKQFPRRSEVAFLR